MEITLHNVASLQLPDTQYSDVYLHQSLWMCVCRCGIGVLVSEQIEETNSIPSASLQEEKEMKENYWNVHTNNNDKQEHLQKGTNCLPSCPLTEHHKVATLKVDRLRRKLRRKKCRSFKLQIFSSFTWRMDNKCLNFTCWENSSEMEERMFWEVPQN